MVKVFQFVADVAVNIVNHIAEAGSVAVEVVKKIITG